MPGNLRKSMLAGSVWMLLSKALDRSIGLISTMIVARILSPEDYGVMAMAMAVYGLVEIMSRFGFDIVLIQKTEINATDYNSAWTLRLLVYLFLSILFYSLSSYIADYYKDERLEGVVKLLCLAMLATGFVNIAIVDFRRDLKFRKEFLYLLSVKIVGFLTVVPAAYYFENYWALIIGICGAKISQIVFSYTFRPYFPRFSLKQVSLFFNFSKWLFFTNFITYIILRLPSLILGRLVGAKEAGLYHVGFELTGYVTTELTASVNRAVFPGYAKLKDNVSELKRNFLDVISVQSILILPLGLGFSAVSPQIIEIVLGEGWSDMSSVIMIIAIGSTISAIISNINYIYITLGVPNLSTYVATVKLVIFAPLLYVLASRYGALGAAYSYLITMALIPFVHFMVMGKLLHTSLFEVLSKLIRPVIAAILMYSLVSSELFIAGPLYVDNVILQLLIMAISGALIYTLSIVLLWFISGMKENSAERRVLNIALDIYKKYKQ